MRVLLAVFGCLLAALGGDAHAKARRPGVVTVPNITRTHEVFQAIKSRLAKLGYRERRVVVREFSEKRLPIAIETGTDRDQHSGDWQWHGFDSDAATRTNRGITQDKLIFGLDVDMSKMDIPDKTPAPHPGTLHAWEAYAAPYYQRIGATSKGVAIAVYKRSGLERAQVGDQRRAASVEFWFKGKPKDQLLFVIKQAPKKP